MNVADTPEDAMSFVAEHGWSWPQLQDPKRERARRLGATYQPHFVLIDAEGGIVATREGGGDSSAWSAMLAMLP